MTKHASNAALARIIKTNKVNIQTAAYVKQKEEAKKGERETD
jgi:hypothetical protein